MNWYKISQQKGVLDALASAVKYVFNNSSLKVLSKRQLAPTSAMKEYGAIEFYCENIKFKNDAVYFKVFYYIWKEGETDFVPTNYESLPKNIPVYKCFIEGKKPNLWPSDENIDTLKDKYGQFAKLVLIDQGFRSEMSEIGRFEYKIGESIEIANAIKAIIDNWGDNGDFEEVFPPTEPVGSGLVYDWKRGV